VDADNVAWAIDFCICRDLDRIPSADFGIDDDLPTVKTERLGTLRHFASILEFDIHIEHVANKMNDLSATMMARLSENQHLDDTWAYYPCSVPEII